MPKIFKVRWTEFTYDLFRSILLSWNALVVYFKANESNAKCAGYLKFLTSLEYLKCIAFVGDLLLSFKKIQKRLQSESLTIISLVEYVRDQFNSIASFKDNELPGGFKTILDTSLNYTYGNIFLKDVELFQLDSLSSGLRSDLRGYSVVRVQILETFTTFLEKRFTADEEFLSIIKPFIELQ